MARRLAPAQRRRQRIRSTGGVLDDDGGPVGSGLQPGHGNTVRYGFGSERRSIDGFGRQGAPRDERGSRSAATDAVNVSQLQSEDAKVNNVSNNVSNLRPPSTTSSSTVAASSISTRTRRWRIQCDRHRFGSRWSERRVRQCW
ncbi:hypothetical protein ACFFYR_10405 [Paraburkholderia dipogonis]|uniref:hypothetical protein n=1 Tax=Paraburkholderia dipogonis TaxID=1211383 RepID=UPI0035EE290E